MGQLILARAGATDFDDQERITGTLDIPINRRGQAELAELAQQWEDLKLDLIYSANGVAARESARFLGKQLGVRVKVLEKLTNVDFGLWQGLLVDEVRRKHPRVVKQLDESPTGVCPPAGETLEQVVARVQKALKPVLKKVIGSSVALIAPDPLRLVIRGEISQTEIPNLLEPTSQSLWESIPLSGWQMI